MTSPLGISVKERFWMVWCIGRHMGTVRHPTFQTAVAEAERLSKKNPGLEFVVLSARALVKTEKPLPPPLYTQWFGLGKGWHQSLIGRP